MAGAWIFRGDQKIKCLRLAASAGALGMDTAGERVKISAWKKTGWKRSATA
jgi:hypothetical protein